MSALQRWASAFTDPRDYDQRLLVKAIGAGRVRGIFLELTASVFAAGDRAEATLRQGLRDARALHSRERRFVADALRDLIKLSAVFDRSSAGGHRFHHHWFAWLALQGASIDALHSEWTQLFDEPSPTFLNAQQWLAQLRPLHASLSPIDQLRLFGALDAPVARSLIHTFGEDAFDVISASNRRAPVVLRVNQRRVKRQTVLSTLRANGLNANEGRWAQRCVVLGGRPNLDQQPGYRQGHFEVQDEGSQLLAKLVQCDGPVVDFCAGAGGKSLAIADAHPNTRLLALDIRPRALNELQRRAKRAGVRTIRCEVVQKEGPLPKAAQRLVGSASCVLVDAPCSGTGVWRRHPEYRWRTASLHQLPALQLSLLTRAAPLVATGGELIYATCSLLHLENDQVVQRFLSENTDFSLISVAEKLGDERTEALGGGPFLRLNPYHHGTDGFFGAILRRS